MTSRCSASYSAAENVCAWTVSKYSRAAASKARTSGPHSARSSATISSYDLGTGPLLSILPQTLVDHIAAMRSELSGLGGSAPWGLSPLAALPCAWVVRW